VTDDNRVAILFWVPVPGDRPSEFRRAFLIAIRDAIAKARFAGKLDGARAEECFRALPIEEPRQ
jgi:hypothetical protein